MKRAWVPGSLLAAVLGAAGCAPKPVMVVNPTFDFSKVRRVSVIPFDGPGGAAAADEFVRQLVPTGIEVTDAKHPGDVVLKGGVTEYKPNVQLMVSLGDENTIVTAVSQMAPEAAVVAAHKTQVASAIADVGIQARLEEPSSHRIVWADSFSYEGIDLPTTLSAVVDSLTRSMKRVIPLMNKAKPL